MVRNRVMLSALSGLCLFAHAQVVAKEKPIAAKKTVTVQIKNIDKAHLHAFKNHISSAANVMNSFTSNLPSGPIKKQLTQAVDNYNTFASNIEKALNNNGSFNLYKSPQQKPKEQKETSIKELSSKENAKLLQAANDLNAAASEFKKATQNLSSEKQKVASTMIQQLQREAKLLEQVKSKGANALSALASGLSIAASIAALF